MPLWGSSSFKPRSRCPFVGCRTLLDHSDVLEIFEVVLRVAESSSGHQVDYWGPLGGSSHAGGGSSCHLDS